MFLGGTWRSLQLGKFWPFSKVFYVSSMMYEPINERLEILCGIFQVDGQVTVCLKIFTLIGSLHPFRFYFVSNSPFVWKIFEFFTWKPKAFFFFFLLLGKGED